MTGAVAISAAAVVDATGFFTGVGVALVVDVAALVGVTVVFFTVDPVPCATFDMFPTLAIHCKSRTISYTSHSSHCRAAFCCLS